MKTSRPNTDPLTRTQPKKRLPKAVNWEKHINCTHFRINFMYLYQRLSLTGLLIHRTTQASFDCLGLLQVVDPTYFFSATRGLVRFRAEEP